jgi:hypothetical protein
MRLRLPVNVTIGAVGIVAVVVVSGCTSAHRVPLIARVNDSTSAHTTSSSVAGSTPVPTLVDSPSTSNSPLLVAPHSAISTAAALAAPGNPSGAVPVPAAGQPVDTSHPTRVIGDGTAASCTSAAVTGAVAAGGIITFSCGPAPVTIAMATTAKVINTSAQVVLDGGGKVTLDGGGVRRILYMDTCDQAQVWTTSHCQDQPTPQLTVQGLTFANGNSTGQTFDGGGGGAIFDRGGRLKVVNSRFVNNRCEPNGPDLGGAAVRALSQSSGQPVYVVGSTFTGGSCANGAALSSIGVSWVVLNSVFSGGQATGHGANPAQAGTPGGGSGGAIYTDGNQYTVSVAGSVITGNHANAGGGAIFFVSNDHTGTLAIDHSQLSKNPSDGFQTLPGIYFLGAGTPTITNSTIS